MLLCAFFDASAVEQKKALNKILSGFNINDVSGRKERGSIYQKINGFCTANKAHPVIYSTCELAVFKGLYSLAQKVGYQVRKVNGEECYVIDISWPSIKACAKIVAAEQPDDSLLKKFLKQVGDISFSYDNEAKTNFCEGQKDIILAQCDNFFDLSELSDDKKKRLREIIGKILDNYSGFQRFASLLVVGLLNSEKGVFASNFTKIKIKETSGKDSSRFSCSENSVYIEDDCYRDDGLEWIFVHELTHAFHYMVCKDVSYKNFIPLLVQTVTSNGNFCDMFFPMLTEYNLDPKNNPILNYIQTTLESNENKVKEVIDDVVKISQGNKSDSKIANALFYVLTTIVKSGFGKVVLGDSWEKCLADTLDVKSLARAIYVRVFAFSEEDSSVKYWVKNKNAETPYLSSTDNGLVVNWKDCEEILTIFGITPLLFKGKHVILEDRQNQQIFQWREMSKDANTEREAEIFRTHALNFSLNSATRLIKNFIEDITGTVVNEIPIDAQAFYNLLFPKVLVHRKIDAPQTGDSVTIYKGSPNDPLGNMYRTFSALY
jgi:hypothetical protein